MAKASSAQDNKTSDLEQEAQAPDSTLDTCLDDDVHIPVLDDEFPR